MKLLQVIRDCVVVAFTLLIVLLVLVLWGRWQKGHADGRAAWHSYVSSLG